VSVWHHTDFKFHRRITQIGCYWGGGGHTELYLVEGDRLALIDTGVADTPGLYVEPALRAIGRSLKDLEVVINTHGHHDHAGGNRQVWEVAHCEIWVPEPDVPITQDANLQFDLFFARNQRLVGQEDRLEHARREIAASAGEPAPVSRRLLGGDVLDLGKGVELRVVSTPGHTLGCSTFVWEREGIAISGDSVLGRGSRDGGMPLIFYPELYRETIDKIRGLHPRALCLGHHYRTLRQTNESIRYGDLVAAFLDESAEVATIVEMATEQAVASLGEEAPFAEIARRALAAIGERMPLRNEPGGEWPNGAIAPISAYWSKLTGNAV
jgi:glyoxylase-like metal-dependent hydrolase (beta-lactamase superfamily II)